MTPTCRPPLLTPQSNTTPLHKAAENGHTAMAELLLNKGADVNAVDEVRWGGQLGA